MARPVGRAPTEDSLRRRPVEAAGSELIVDDVVVGCVVLDQVEILQPQNVACWELLF